MVGGFPPSLPLLKLPSPVSHWTIKDGCLLCLDWSLLESKNAFLSAFEQLSYLTYILGFGKGLLTHHNNKVIPSLSYHHTP